MVLEAISKREDHNLVDYSQGEENNIGKLDWDYANDFDRDWVKILGPMLIKKLGEMAYALGFESIVLKNMWYQQYGKGSKHQWHHHVSSNWSAVYYLRLPNNLGTELYDITESRTFDIKLNEGDLFLFPANMLHRSPPNMTNKIKTIISFNIDFNEVI